MAILTPMIDTNVPDGTPDAPRQIAVPPGTTINSPYTSSSAVIVTVATSSSAPQTVVSQSSESQAIVQLTEKDSKGTQSGGDLQQNADTQSQQQNDSSETSEQGIALADAKHKPAAVKQDDNVAAGAAEDHTTVAGTPLTSFPDPARVAVATQSDRPTATPMPFQSTGDTLRTSEPEFPAAPQLRAGAAQEISIRIEQPDAPTIDLRVVERAGQLHVDVRSSDTSMQSSLRQDLGTLTNSLERAGYHSEMFTSSSTFIRMASSAQMSNQEDHQDQSQNRGGTSDGRRQPPQQKRPSTWLEEMEGQ